MPALPSVPNTLRIDKFFQLGADSRAKVADFWTYFTGPPTVGELNTVAAAVRLAFATDVASVMAAGYSLIETIVTDLSSPTGAVGTDSTAVAGTRAGTNVMDAAACVLRSKHINRRYRGGHSREYWPFGLSGDLGADEQHWSGAFVTEVTEALQDLDDATTTAVNVWGNPSGPVAVSFYHGFTTHTGVTGRVRNVSTPRAAAVVDPISSVTVQSGIASQRRRLLHLA